MSGEKTLDQKLREFSEAHDRAQQPTHPVWLNRIEWEELCQCIHYAPSPGVIKYEHGEWLGTIYGLELHYEDTTLPAEKEGKPYVNRVDLQWYRAYAPEIYRAMEGEIMAAYNEGRVR